MRSRAAATNPRVKKPVYHLSISPAQGDTLSTTQWLKLIKDLLKQRHLAEHQYIAVLHRDATYPDGSMCPYVHLVINENICVSSIHLIPSV